MENFSMYNFLRNFNRSDFRRKSIPQELVSGWPSVEKIGKTLCVTIPYYGRIRGDNNYYLKPIYCSVTVPLKNPERIFDFTIYPYSKDWQDIGFSKPIGTFKHKALADVKTNAEYKELCQQLYSYYDKMVEAILAKKPFADEDEMKTLFSRLMEPGLYPLYLRINKKFFSYFCKL